MARRLGTASPHHGRVARIAATVIAGMIPLTVISCSSGGSSTTGSASAEPAATQTVTVTATGPAGPVTATPTTSATPDLPTSPVAGAMFLSDNDPLSSTYGVENGAATVNGRSYARSVSMRTDRSSVPTNEAEYNLERTWQTFSTTIGVRDDSPTGTVLTFEVFVDGRSAARQTLSLGQSQDLSLDVHGVLRLKIVVTYATTADLAGYCYGVWGDARLGS